MAGNGEIRIKREIEDDEGVDPLAMPDSGISGPKIIRLGSLNSPSTVKYTPIAPKPKEGSGQLPAKGPDLFMLNKPAPIPFNLPKEASLAPRVVKDDPMNDPPHVALNKLEGEAKALKEEVAALKWLAKRKEQEWNSILVLLKKKEENWMRVKRQADLVATDPSFNKLRTIINPAVASTSMNNPTRMPSPPPPITIMRPQTIKVVSRATPTTPTPSPAMIIQSNQPTKKVLVPVSQPLTGDTLKALQSQGLVKSGGMTADGKRIIVVKKSLAQSGQIKIIPKNSVNPSSMTTMATSGIKVVTSTSSPSVMSSVSVTGSNEKNKRAPSLCQACYKVPPKFECSGCSNMWYCSQICQRDNWTTHQHKCKTVIKQEVPDEID